MPKTRQQKEEIIKSLAETLKQSKGAVFVDFTGLKVSEVEDLRHKLGAEKAQFIAIKKSLFEIALNQAELGVDVKSIVGQLSLASSNQDEVVPAKVLAKFAKDHEALKITGGILEQKFIDAAKVKELAKLPGREELLGRVIGSVVSPLSGLVTVLQGNLSGLVRALDAVRAKKA